KNPEKSARPHRAGRKRRVFWGKATARPPQLKERKTPPTSQAPRFRPGGRVNDSQGLYIIPIHTASLVCGAAGLSRPKASRCRHRRWQRPPAHALDVHFGLPVSPPVPASKGSRMATWKVLCVVAFGCASLALVIATIIVPLALTEADHKWLWFGGLLLAAVVVSTLFTLFLRSADRTYDQGGARKRP